MGFCKGLKKCELFKLRKQIKTHKHRMAAIRTNAAQHVLANLHTLDKLLTNAAVAVSVNLADDWKS